MIPTTKKSRKREIAETTSTRGTRIIDFILIDKAFRNTVTRVGTLGIGEGVVSDHVFIYADFSDFFKLGGVQNRPVLYPSREFVIERADKVEKI